MAELTEAERVTLVMLKSLPPILVYALGDLHPSNGELTNAKLRILVQEGFFEAQDGYPYPTTIARGIKENLENILVKMYPPPEPEPAVPEEVEPANTEPTELHVEQHHDGSVSTEEKNAPSS